MGAIGRTAGPAVRSPGGGPAAGSYARIDARSRDIAKGRAHGALLRDRDARRTAVERWASGRALGRSYQRGERVIGGASCWRS